MTKCDVQKISPDLRLSHLHLFLICPAPVHKHSTLSQFIIHYSPYRSTFLLYRLSCGVNISLCTGTIFRDVQVQYFAMYRYNISLCTGTIFRYVQVKYFAMYR
jgi:hypothetical protein